MTFTVTRPGGITDPDFEVYARLLRQSGADLGKLPRVPEPGTGRRWLHAWNRHEEAEAFANELKERTGEGTWEVVEANGNVSEGPLGPIIIQLARQAEGLTFTLHPLSRALIRSAFPRAVTLLTAAFIDTDSWHHFRKTSGGLGELVSRLAPGLTGLTTTELESLGWIVVDAATGETLAAVPSAIPSHV